ncbi:hypothetical protein HN873_017520 [Arachis hypogaea]
MADLREGDIRLLVKVEVINLLPRVCSPSLRIYVVYVGTCWANVWGDGRTSVSSVNGLGLVFCRTIPGLDASGEENFDGFGDTGDIDATESLLDIGMETEEEELGEESPNEEDGEQNGSAEHSCLDRIVEETYVLEMKNGVGTAAQGSAAGGQDGVRDPVAVRTKGTGRAQEPFGCRGIKRRKCSNCGVVGHRRTRCPSGPCSQPVCTQDLAEGALGRDDSQSHGTVSGNDKQSKSRRRTVHVTSTPLHDA